jgi:hypothetical protein
MHLWQRRSCNLEDQTVVYFSDIGTGDDDIGSLTAPGWHLSSGLVVCINPFREFRGIRGLLAYG